MPAKSRNASALDTGKQARAAIERARAELYAARQFLGRDTQADLKVRIPFDVYFQDPFVTNSNKAYNFDQEFDVPWEPGLTDGPTSARFAVVDYDSGTETLAPAARWHGDLGKFVDTKGKVLDRRNLDSPQFRQMNVWATLQNALDFFEAGFGLGRRIDWGFEGNRLIVVPHAGYGENAFYDRDSKSLQFYYFDSGKDGERKRIHTCLSADIVNHEFGHAVLDGIRPHYHESVFAETAAFHEFLGDLSAILIAFRNTAFRSQIAKATGGDLDKDNPLGSLAEEFGRNIGDQDYLRSALNTLKYKDVKDDQRQHYMSQVLTGAMFDIIRRLTAYYMKVRRESAKKALWSTIRRMQCMAVQPLDLLPPVDVTFEDYALAVLRAEQIANPTDPDGYRNMMIEVFVERGLLSEVMAAEQKKPTAVFARLNVSVFHDPLSIATSRANAYRFLDDNRRDLFIPFAADVIVTDLSTAQKLTLSGRRLPRQVLLQYIWREDVVLKGARFGRYAGAVTSLLCGGTLALDIDGNKLAWARKPGTLPLIKGSRTREGEDDEVKRGIVRREAFLDALAARIAAGRIGDGVAGGAAGLLEKSIAPLTAERGDGTVRFSLSPHIGIRSDKDEEMGERPWQVSS
ncbi:serine protease [Mesorhizobium sp. M0571]|uniref:serine protease n=1 Tax=Mesorhizobium sp. M0571 TaxID=2956960 RepID=UPI00333526D0